MQRSRGGSTSEQNGSEAKEAKHGTSTFHSKVLFSSSDSVNMEEARHEGSGSASVAPDSPVTVVFESLSLLDDATSPSGNFAGINEKKELATGDHRKLDQSQCRRKRTILYSQYSVALTNLEIDVKHGDMSSTGLGNVGETSAKLMISELSKCSLNANEIKRLLDDLLDRAINDDKQLMEKENLYRAVGVISSIMERHIGDAEVLSKAFITASQLCGNHDSIVVSRELLAPTMRILQMHYKDPSLLCDGWRWLQTLTLCDSDARRAIANANGVEVILNGMRQHSNHDGLQGSGCYFLGYMAFDTESQCRIAESNGIALILQAMQRHAQVEDIQDWGCFALAKLTENHQVDPRAIVKARGVIIIQQAMRHFPENWGVQDSGGVVLEWLHEQLWNSIEIRHPIRA